MSSSSKLEEVNLAAETRSLSVEPAADLHQLSPLERVLGAEVPGSCRFLRRAPRAHLSKLLSFGARSLKASLQSLSSRPTVPGPAGAAGRAHPTVLPRPTQHNILSHPRQRSRTPLLLSRRHVPPQARATPHVQDHHQRPRPRRRRRYARAPFLTRLLTPPKLT